MSPPAELIRLVEQFDRNVDAYRSGKYNEAQVRREFIDPLFERCLGWDIHNTKGDADQYKQVIHEDSIKIGALTKAPDYCFRIGGTRKFFLEAKKPSVNIKEDYAPAFQLRRYGWSAKLPLSILTDFDEFAAYDCRVRPQKTDKASTARILYIEYREYPNRWKEIYDVFSWDAVRQGSFDKYADLKKGKKGTSEVDDAFLEEIESWRDILARNIALRNQQITQRELNYAVQQTIDRIIFLRICEDRGIETYGHLQGLSNGHNIYPRLVEYFRRADDRYNSGLFHFHKERDRDETPDTLTPSLNIDDNVIKDILRKLYYPDSPYAFSVLPADILGQVYEQFLGKVIRLTSGRRAVVEDKPEVKKAGGVYYTPSYIVDYIVSKTVGDLLKGKTPAQVSKLRILDPACGSGSFLLGAYQCLLDWHLQFYRKSEVKKHQSLTYLAPGNEYRLVTAEKKRILLNNIYGVDIDPQAVEVTKLSLLLKVLEGESDESISRQLKLFHERALPDLSQNIKCGNSLIGPDYYEKQQMTMLIDEEERYRVNAFDWQSEFAEIIKAGGFHVIIGNPPWGAELNSQELDYLKKVHRQIVVRMVDSFMYFVHKSSKLLADNGEFGMIIPSTFLTQADSHLLRKYLLTEFSLRDVINLGDKVFGPRVLNTSSIVNFTHRSPLKSHSINVDDCRHLSNSEKASQLQILNAVDYSEWSQLVAADSLTTFFTLNFQAVLLFQKLKERHQNFNTIIEGEIQRGVSPDYAEAFVVDSGESQTLEKEVLRPLVLGKDVARYKKLASSSFLIYLTRKDDIAKYPNVAARLNRYREKITCREVKEGKHPWYSLHRPRDPGIFSAPKFIGLTTSRKICVALDSDGNYYATDSLYLFRLKSDVPIKQQYVLGVLHSACFQFLYQVSCQGEQRVIPQIKAAKLYDLPFPVPNISNKSERHRHDRLVDLVERNLLLHDKTQARVPRDHERVRRDIDSTDKAIDALVYELYGLTDKEIAIIENETSK